MYSILTWQTKETKNFIYQLRRKLTRAKTGGWGVGGDNQGAK